MPHEKPNIKNLSPGFANWLHQKALTLFITTYQHDRLIILSAKCQETICVSAYPFDRPMGVSVSSSEIHLATRNHILKFESSESESYSYDSHDSVYRFSSAIPTGFLDTHDLVKTSKGAPVLVDTLHSCLREIGDETKIIWKPEFISELVPEDRCHLNGLAIEKGRPRFATFVAESDQAEAWRKSRREGGKVIDIDSNQTLSENLSMPHSPRIYQDRLWLLNAGKGEFGFIDSSGIFEPFAFCPGFLRGLAFHQNHAVIGVSQARSEEKLKGIELGKSLCQKGEMAFCGIVIIDLLTGKMPFKLEWDLPMKELFDIQIISGIGHPKLLKRFDKRQNHLQTF